MLPALWERAAPVLAAAARMAVGVSESPGQTGGSVAARTTYRWCRGPVGATLLQPLADSTRTRGARIMTGRRVKQIAVDGGGLKPLYR